MKDPFLKRVVKKVKGNKLVSFLFFLLVSCSLWLSLTLNRVYETNISVCVHIVDVPDDVRLVNGNDVEVVARVKGVGTELVGYIFDDRVDVVVSYADFVRNGGDLFTPTGIIQNQVAGTLDASVKLCGFSKDTLRAEVQSASQKVPVVKDIRNLVTSGCCELVSHVYSHDSVTVTAYVDVLPSIKSVYTEPLICDGLTCDSVFELKVLPGDYISVCPQIVRVDADVSCYVEKEMAVLVEYVRFPSDVHLNLLPSEVVVKFKVLESNSEKVNATDFSVRLMYEDYLSHVKGVGKGLFRDAFKVNCTSSFVGEYILQTPKLSDFSCAFNFTKNPLW